MLSNEERARVRSCLLGGALGDAWGGPYEGRAASLDTPFPGRPCLSDDTLLTAATCEAIVHSGGMAVAEGIADRMRVWFDDGRLRGLGSATLKALRDLSAGAHWALAGARGEFAAGSGSAMRAAPLAFLLDPTNDGDRRTIRDISRITHHSDEAYAATLAIVIANQVAFRARAVPPDLLARVVELLPDTAVRDRIDELSAVTLSVAEAGNRFGSSGHAVDAIPLALFAAVQTAGCPLEQVILAALSAGGDTDTIAALAGQIAGASGQSVPEELLARVDDIATIATIFDRFAESRRLVSTSY